jgi:hypothetical protein
MNTVEQKRQEIIEHMDALQDIQQVITATLEILNDYFEASERRLAKIKDLQVEIEYLEIT